MVPSTEHNLLQNVINDYLVKIRLTRRSFNDYQKLYKNIDTQDLLEQLSVLEKQVKLLNSKPIIGCFGAFDSGKSTFLNTILGKQVLPESYQPATSVITLIMHTKDKPACIQGKVAIFKKGFEINMIYSQEDIKTYLLAEGDEELLYKLGVHQYDKTLATSAYIAIIFEYSSILEEVWLLDTPGDFNTADEEDTEKALTGLEMTDAIIYISSHNGFLSGTELDYTIQVLLPKPPINAAKPLDHILFIQSHCHTGIKEEHILESKKIAFKRLQKKFNQEIFNHWLESGAIKELPTSTQLTERTHAFWRENEDYTGNIVNQIYLLTKHLSQQNGESSFKTLSLIHATLTNAVQSKVLILEDKKSIAEKQKNHILERKKSSLQKAKKITIEEANKLLELYENRYGITLDEIIMQYEKLVSIDNIEKMLIKNFNQSKHIELDVEEQITSLIYNMVSTLLKDYLIEVNKNLNIFLEEWQKLHFPLHKVNMKQSISLEPDVLDTLKLIYLKSDENLINTLNPSKIFAIIVFLMLFINRTKQIRIDSKTKQRLQAEQISKKLMEGHIHRVIRQTHNIFWQHIKTDMLMILNRLRLEENLYSQQLLKDSEDPNNIPELENSIIWIKSLQSIMDKKSIIYYGIKLTNQLT